MGDTLKIVRKELLSFFVSPLGYFVLSGFFFLSAYFFLFLLNYYNTLLQQYGHLPVGMLEHVPNLNDDVIEPYFQTLMVVLVFLIPVLTMRLLAEEKKNRTFEYLLIAPISLNSIVIGKFLGVAFVIFLMLSSSTVFPAIAYVLGNPRPDGPPILSGLLGLFLYSLGYAALGLAVSSLTRSQIIAAVGSTVLMLVLFMIHSPAQTIGGAIGQLLMYLSPPLHCRSMIGGVIESSSLVFFGSVICVGLFVAARAMEAHRWR